MEQNNNQNFIDSSIKILAVLGLVAIIFIGSLGALRLFSSVPDIFSSIANTFVGITSRFIPAEKVVLSVEPERISSGEAFSLSFEHESKVEEGSYTFIYECRDGVFFERRGQTIFCNTEYSLLNEDTVLNLQAFSTEAQSTLVPMEIRFTRNNSDDVDVRGSERVVILNNNLGAESDSSGTNEIIRRAGERTESIELFDETVTGGGRPSDPQGQIDLAARILEVGVVDIQTNKFTATSSVPTSARVAVKFEVENIGSKASGSWLFNAVLPSFPRHIFHSDSQISLAPGDRIEFILGFDSIRNDGADAVFVVNVDPAGAIRESNENNNIKRTTIEVFEDN